MNDEDYLFEHIYARALRHFPETFFSGERLKPNYEKLTGIVTGIEEVSALLDDKWASESKKPAEDKALQIFEQEITYRLFACLHKLLLQIDEVAVAMVNPSYVRFRFHTVLAECVFPQIRGESAPDGTFDLDAVIRYARVNKLKI